MTMKTKDKKESKPRAERKTYRNVRGYVVVRRSTAEIESLRSGLASGDTHTPDTPVFWNLSRTCARRYAKKFTISSV